MNPTILMINHPYCVSPSELILRAILKLLKLPPLVVVWLLLFVKSTAYKYLDPQHYHICISTEIKRLS